MPRIPPEEIERLKKEIPIQRLAEAKGIKLKPHGKDLIGLCGFHEDHSPSLVISTEKNLWNCLGACSAGGTVIDWVMKAENVSFRHAVEILREGANFPTVKEASTVKPYKRLSTIPKLPSPVDLGAEDRELMEQTIDYYHQTLKESPEALSYLEKRGLKNPEVIDCFKLGYANRTLGYRLPDKDRKTGAAIRERLTSLGILRKTGHEHFSGCLIIPIFNERNQVTGIYGRKIRDEQRADAIHHLYLSGPHKGVWNLEAFKDSKEIILCEALIDALTFRCADFRNVTASYGVNGFTPDHWEALKKHGVERVYIAYDHDEAGNKNAEKLSKELVSEGFECFRMLFPRGMDANEYALKVKPAGKSLELVYRNAVPLGGGKPLQSEVSEMQEEPKEATKMVNHFEAIPSLETGTQPLKPQKDVQPQKQEPEPAQIAPIPQAPASGPVIEIKGEEIFILLEDRRWRFRGLEKNVNADHLKVNILVSRGEIFFVDTLDLYSARSRMQFQKQASEELKVKEDVIKADLGKLLVRLEELRTKQIRENLEPKEKEVVLTPMERAEALELLKDPNFLKRILSDFDKTGIVGEETNKLVGYLAAVSRKLVTPLGIIIQSSSAAGKTSLMEAVLAFTPEEERVKYSAMTGQSLFYMGETNLKHKILAIVEEAGAEKASYAMKLLQSEGELTIASTGKDPVSGKLITNEYRVEGPVMLFLTTTKVDIDEELQNRCIMLAVDESREQTRAIHWIQREKRTLAGMHAKDEREKILRIHRNAQRLLKPIKVINHYAHELTFLEDKIRLRRDHEKYLNLIDALTFIQQFQRPVKIDRKNGKETPFLEVTFEDIEIANRLADEVLGRSLEEIPPQTKKLLLMIETMVLEACQKLNLEQCEYRFTRRTVREYSGWGNTQLKLHLDRLQEFEYLIPHRGFKGQNYVYELIYDGKGKDGKPFLSGLINVEKLRSKYGYISNLSGVNDENSGSLRPHIGPISGPFRGSNSSGNNLQESVSPEFSKNAEKHIDTGIAGSGPTYPENGRNPISSMKSKEGKAFVSGIRDLM